MGKLKTFTITYQNKNYLASVIPDIFTGSKNCLTIGCHSLSLALYNEKMGFFDNKAKIIDEQIYAYLDDNDFNLNEDSFLKTARKHLD